MKNCRNLAILERKINKLLPEKQKEVIDFVDFLLMQSRQKKMGRKKFSFNWAGNLSDLKDKFTSVELQHKALEWW